MGTGAPVAFTVTPSECNYIASYSNVLVILLVMTVSMHASCERLPIAIP